MHRVKIEVIINANSGTGHAPGVEQRVAEAFKAGGAEVRISLAATGAEVLSCADRAAKSDAEILVAGGGDGTINSVAAAVVGSNKILGILPFGTMNHFAKDLRIPLDLDGAVDTIVAGHESHVDIGEVNGHIFINNSSLGLYPSIVHKREVQQRLGWGKLPAYIWAAMAIMRRYPFLNVRVGVDGKELRSRTPFIFVGNNEYEMEKLNIGSRVCLNKNELSLYMTNRTGRLGLVRLALRALFGGLRQDKDFVALRTNDISIETRHKHLRVALDGEVLLLAPPLHYRIQPGALRVLTPSEKPGGGDQVSGAGRT
jgi:YegS/Rv2252/BmrU family lipid kinase